jgi:hypothetical protein
LLSVAVFVIVYHIAIFACLLVGGGAFDSEKIPYLILSSSACGRGRELAWSFSILRIRLLHKRCYGGVIERGTISFETSLRYNIRAVGMSSEWILHGSQ